MRDDIVIEEKLPDPTTFNSLRRSVGWEEHDANCIELAFRNTRYAVMATDREGTVVGFGRVIGDEGMFYYIQDVIVVPEHQGKGIGNDIMNRLMGFIEVNRKDKLFVGLMSAKGKEGFYKKFGFTERPDDACGAGMYREY